MNTLLKWLEWEHAADKQTEVVVWQMCVEIDIKKYKKVLREIAVFNCG